MNDNTGHGHVWNRPDGMKARCGGPALCGACRADKSRFDMHALDRKAPTNDESLRDKFAMAAITGMFANPAWDEAKSEDMAIFAYSVADRMLTERAK